MLDIKGKSILARQVEALNAAGDQGHRGRRRLEAGGGRPPEPARPTSADESGGELASLMAAAAELEGRTVVLYGDILFDRELRRAPAPGRGRRRPRRGPRRRRTGRAEPRPRARRSARAETGGRFLPGSDDRSSASARDLEGANGEWIGMLMLSPGGRRSASRTLYDELAKAQGDRPLHQAQNLRRGGAHRLPAGLVDDGLAVRTIDTYKGWMEIDTFEDYRRAWGAGATDAADRTSSSPRSSATATTSSPACRARC